MKNRKMLLPALLSIALAFSLIFSASVVGASATVPRPDDHSIIHSTVDSSSAASAMALNMPQGNVTPMVAAGYKNTVGLKSDGTVVAVGDNDYGQCEVGGWTDIIEVTTGFLYTVGLKADGTVVAAGLNEYGECNVGGWTGITQVAALGQHTVGLKSDGTVVAVGSNYRGQCNVGGWTNITKVAVGAQHTVGLKPDGTVVAAGDNEYGQCDVGNWTDIAQVAAGAWHTLGLKDDGAVVAVGWNAYGQCDVGNWTDIVQVATGEDHTVGLKSDGTVIAVGYNDAGQCNLSDWNLVLAVPASQHILTISSTAGGNVTTPGEGTFIYGEGTVVNLVAEPEEGYPFVKWTGDVDTIGNVTAAATNITMDDNYSVTANFVGVEAGNVSVKAGDWIKVEYKITGWPAGEPYPDWLKLEFLSVEGTGATVNATMRMSDGTEQSDTVRVDLAAGGGEAFGLSGFVISANLTTGDSVYMTGYGNVTIAGETTRTYAGASRTVVYASISQYGLTYYWDKLTGVMVESSTTYSGITATAKATETNMWEAAPPAVGMTWWLWVIVAAAIVALAIVVYRLKKRKTPTAPTLPTEGT
jgi:hypothetical protein